MYKKLIDGIDMISEALMEIGADKDNKPVKLIVARIVNHLGFNDLGDDIAMLRFAVENDDLSLTKLTARIMGNTADASDDTVPE
jgi:hypothetical protein